MREKKNKFVYVSDDDINLILKYRKEGMIQKIIAEKLGLKEDKVQRILKNPDYHRKRYAEMVKRRNEEKIVASLYKDHPIKDIMKITGLSWRRIRTISYALGISRDKETNIRFLKNAINDLELKKRMSQKIKLVRKMEVMRVMGGLPQKTKLRITLVPIKTRRAANRLSFYYNYFRLIDDHGPYTVFYDNNTKRKEKLEELYKKRYGFNFVPSDDYIEPIT